jgi:hypothetical protein
MLASFVQETANAPGTAATINLGGAVAGRVGFAAAYPSGATCFYALDDGTQGEWGIGTVTHGSPVTLVRTTVLGNTAGTTARLNFTAITRVYATLPAERAVWRDPAGLLVLGAPPTCELDNAATKPAATVRSRTANSATNGLAETVLTTGSGAAFTTRLGGTGTAGALYSISYGTQTVFLTAGNSGGLVLGTENATPVILGTAGAERLRVASDGTVTLSGLLQTREVNANPAGNDTTASAWIRNQSGSGDGALAALGFLCAGTYGCKLHLRSDGYFGLGGWSASPWRWYVNLANGDMSAGQDIYAGRNISAVGRVYASGYECISAATGWHDVGMIARARRADAWGFVNVTYTPGSTIGGGSLWIENSTATLPGTWRCLGFSGPSWDESQTFWPLALWQRIA